MKTFYEYFNERQKFDEVDLNRRAALRLGAASALGAGLFNFFGGKASASDAGPALAFKLQTKFGSQIELDEEDLKIESYSGDKNKFLFKGSATNSKNKDPKRFQQEIKEKLESYLNFSASGNAKDFKIKIEPKKEKAFPYNPPGLLGPLMVLQILEKRRVQYSEVRTEDKSKIIYIHENGKKTNFLDRINDFIQGDKNDLYERFGVIDSLNPNNVTFEGSITIVE